MTAKHQRYKIRVVKGDVVDTFCVTFGSQINPNFSPPRRSVLFETFEAADDKAKRLNSQFPDTVYQVVTAETEVPVLPKTPSSN